MKKNIIKHNLPIEYTEYELETAGCVDDDQLKITGHQSSCGKIRDGVGMELGNKGGFVVSKKDFLEIAEIIKQGGKE